MILLYASCPSRYLPQINFNDNVRFGFMLFFLEFTYIIQYLLEWKEGWPSYLFFLRCLSVSFEDKKRSHLFLCKYSNLNFYWQENFPGNFLVNPLMNMLLTDGAFLVINVIFAYKWYQVFSQSKMFLLLTQATTPVTSFHHQIS